ncbi:DUF1382 family protein [Aeromonas media]|uniref:DUF1382 family protein n=1 Tax=Aeromonas media TaxID=651 RepID=UPI0015F936C5
MNRASPADLRKSLEMANCLAKEGILFIPMPVADNQEAEARLAEADARLNEMALAAEREGL